MSALPAPRGFAYNKQGQHHDGWRKRAEHARPGDATYAWFAYEWDHMGMFGRCPARYVRVYKEHGDVHGDFRRYLEASTSSVHKPGVSVLTWKT